MAGGGDADVFTERMPLACLRLHRSVGGKAVQDFDDFIDFETRDIQAYGPVARPDFQAKLFVSESGARAPVWAELFRAPFQLTSPPAAASVAAVLVIRLADKIGFFAFTFGPGGRYLLKDDAWERAYGLRVALNLIYPRTDHSDLGARVVAIDAKRRAGETMRSRRQANRAATFEAFEVDPSRDILSAATGRPADSNRWGSRISGSDGFHFSVNLTFDELGSACAALQRAHDRTDYRERFAWLDHYEPVSDPQDLSRLEGEILQILRSGRPGTLELAPPEIIEWTRVDSFQFHFDGRKGQRRPNLRLSDFLSHLKRQGTLRDLDMEFLRSRRIKAIDADGAPVHSWSVWRCLFGDVRVRGATYVMDEGEFYHVSADFMKDLDAFLAGLPSATLKLPRATPGTREQDYNRRVVVDASGEWLLLDSKLVRAAGRSTPVEICDILTRSRCLVHVKRHLGSSDLSHLFAQGSVSAELLQSDPDFCKAAQRVVNAVAGNRKFSFFYPKPITTSKFEIVYAIIADWRGRKPTEALPFFSKVNLRATCQRLMDRGFKVALTPVSYR